MANLVKFMSGSSASFAALGTKDDNTLYFLNDTKQIYKGEHLYSKSFEVVSILPTSGGVKDVLYVETSTKKLHIWNGSSFVEALDAFVTIDTEVKETGANAVSGKAVYDFVSAEINALTGGTSNVFVSSIVEDNSAIGQFTVKKGAESSTVKVKLDGLAQAPSYDRTSRKFSFPVIGGDAVEIDLGKDLVVNSGTYDTATQDIVLTLVNNDTIRIPVGHLVDIYTGSEDESGAVKITIDNDTNKVKATVNVDGITIKKDNGVLKADFSTLALKSVVEDLAKDVAANETAIENLDTRLTGRIEGVEKTAGDNAVAIANIKSQYVKTADLEANYPNKTYVTQSI
jgi:hypothetical protein